ncbi:MAG: hypothetical protein KA735_04815 [Burkholderiaceae bacterium]|nr:hypothetical protein [Burkholderiaceae bacterium]
MSYKQINVLAFPGQIGLVGESLSRATGEQNVGATVVHAGRFVATASPHGIKAIAAAVDPVQGIVIKSQLQGSYGKDEYLSVGHIGHGDSAWAETTGAALVRGDAVYIVATGVNAGKVTKTDTNNIATNLVVRNVADGLAEVTRKE